VSLANDYQPTLMRVYWAQLDTRFPQVEAVFEDCMLEALTLLTRPAGLDAYLEAASAIGKLGRGVEPMLAFMEEWPGAAKAVGEAALVSVMEAVRAMQKSPNGRAITPFLETLAPVARRLKSQALLQDYLAVTLDFMARTTGSIHGHHTTFPSPGLPEFFAQAPNLLSQLSVAGLKNWVESATIALTPSGKRITSACSRPTAAPCCSVSVTGLC
jgi:nitric oxide reductase NorD protein